ncbi:hypothetical protein Acr_00g0079940 [Actinidia rufa]|uniref:Uncharacterized protein n=1 Tax=Actinidia rufa TaxID=165716 RepID=A0A7J0DU95_9ERIC|nr:hypothetical protein Acr_00g0079940 [Actinidia rufa]
MTLLRWLGGKVEDPFTNLFPQGPSSSLDSKSESLSNFGMPPELRSDALSSRVSPSASTKMAGEKAATKDAGLMTTSQPPSKGVVIQEKLPGTSSLLGDNLGPGASMMSNAAMARKVLNGVIPPADKEKVEQFSSEDLVTKSFHALGQADSAELELVRAQNRALKGKGRLAELGKQAAKSGNKLDKSKVLARLKAEVAELTSKLVQAKKLAIEEFKSSEDFKYPNLGIDVASMEMNAGFAEEEEAAKEGEKEVGNESGATPTS